MISHMAAQLEITRSIANPVYDLTTNTIGTLNVLRAAVELGSTRWSKRHPWCVWTGGEGAAGRIASDRSELGIRCQQARLRKIAAHSSASAIPGCR